MTSVLIEKKEDGDNRFKQTEREDGHVKTEADIGVKLP